METCAFFHEGVHLPIVHTVPPVAPVLPPPKNSSLLGTPKQFRERGLLYEAGPCWDLQRCEGLRLKE